MAQWIQTNINPQIGYNLYVNGNEVYACTRDGVYKTTDTGNPWLSIGPANMLIYDVIKSGSYLLAASEGVGPGVYRTSDNGANWSNAAGITNQSVHAFTKNSSYIFAATWGGGVFRSADDGATWQYTGLNNKGLRTIYTVGETIFAGGDSIYISSNNGAGWVSRALPWPACDTRCFLYTNGVLYAGDTGLYSSTDMGNTWTLSYGVVFDGQNIKSSVMIRRLAVYNNTLIASIAANSIAISFDGGHTFSPFNGGIISDWTFDGLVVKAPYLWALREVFGNAYIRPLSEIVGNEKINNTIPASFSLSQNYPNPFNPATNIIYRLSESCNVELTVFDPLGRVVEIFNEGLKSPGEYKINFNGTKYSAGVYFYKLKAGKYSEVKKMMLLK